MVGLMPFWIIITWMFFPILALIVKLASGGGYEGVEGVAKLRPWPAARCTNEQKPCFLERPAWHDDRPVPGRILFISVGFYGHAMPLLALAEEMANRGHNVTFGTHTCLRAEVEEAPGVAFLSAGRMPMHEHQLRTKLRSLSQSGGFWGLLTLLNDVYLPLARPMYRNLLAAISPPKPARPDSSLRSGTSTRREPNEVAPPGGAVVGGAAVVSKTGGAVVDEGFKRGAGGKVGSREGENFCVDSGGSDDDLAEGSCDAGVGSGRSRGSRREGEAETEVGMGMGRGERLGWGNSSSWGAPFDLVIVDMASLGGLDFAQKLGIPYMFNSPSILFDLSGRHVTATLPGWGTGLGRRMTLGERLQNAISPWAFSVFLTPAFFSINKARREQGLEPLRAQDDVFHGARILVNTAFGFDYPHDLAPLVEMTGPLLPPLMARSALLLEQREAFNEENQGSEAEAEDPLALPFLLRTWLGGTGALIAPGTAAFEASMKQQQAAFLSRGEGNRGDGDYFGDGDDEEEDHDSLEDKGVIYVNLGRMPQVDKWQLVSLLQALSPSPADAMACWSRAGAGGGIVLEEDRLGRYRVLWMLSLEQREQLLMTLLPAAPPPSFRLKVMGGFPHLGVLAHPAVKVVVSHCGMGAAQEALLFGKPLLCLPMLGDQEDVARRVSDAGAGIGLSGLPKGNISSVDIRNAVADLVTDPTFRESAAVVSGVLRRAGGTLRAADVVEGTLQLGGGSHLHHSELREPWLKTSSTDAYILLVAGIILLAVLGYALLAALCFGTFFLLYAAVRSAVFSLRWIVGLFRQIPRLVRSRSGSYRHAGGSRSPDNRVATAAAVKGAAAAAAAAAAVVGSGGGGGGGSGGRLWDETLMALLGGPGPPDPFPEDSLTELDGPAMDR